MGSEPVDLELKRSVATQLGSHMEAAVINAALASPEMLDEFDDLPLASDFIVGWAPIAWDCVLEARKGGFSMVKFTQIMKERGLTIEEVNDILGRAHNAYAYRDETREAIEFLKSRRLVMLSQTCAREYLELVEREPFWKAPASLERLQRQLQDVAKGATHGETWAFGDAVSSERASCVRSGLTDFDEMMGGLQLGVFGVIAARPSIGKTAAACTFAHNIASRGEGAGIFSLEMPAYDLQCRMAAAQAYVRSTRMDYGNSGNPYYQPFFHKKMHGPHLERMTRALADIRKLPIGFDARKGLTITDIRAATRRLKTKLEDKGAPLKVVFVDHIGHITPEKNRGGNRTSETTDITKGLMDMAGDLGVAVVGLSQLNRAVEQRANKRPQLSDLRESGSIEQDAAWVTFLYRDEYYADRAHEDDDAPARKSPVNRNVMEFIIAKQRNGPVGTVEAFCEIGANAILDAENEFARRVA